MKLIELIELIEALKITKKVSDKVIDNPDYQKPIPKITHSNRELPKIGDYKIIITGHTKDIRTSTSDNKARDFNFSDDDYKRVLTKFIYRIKNENLKQGKYTLFYKHKMSNNYDVLGVVFENNKITVSTIIQQDKKPNQYKFSSNISNSKRLILENGVLLELI